jgi:hypothetical protein
MFTKEAIEQIQQSTAKSEVITIGDFQYLMTPNHTQAKLITPPVPHPLQISTLDGITEFLKHHQPDSRIVHIENYRSVSVISDIHPVYQTRCLYLNAEAPKNEFKYNLYMHMEEFIIGVMADFEPTNSCKQLLTFVGKIKSEDVYQSEDDGASQRVTVKSGITTVSTATVPNPVTLCPYLTFSEIDQPALTFIFRIRKGSDGMQCALFKGGSSHWQTETCAQIRRYLFSKVEGVRVIS